MRLRSEVEKSGDRVVSLAPGNWHSRLDHEVRMAGRRDAEGRTSVVVTYGRPGKPKVTRRFDNDDEGWALAEAEVERMVEAFILPLVVERLTVNVTLNAEARALAFDRGAHYRRTHQEE